MQRAELKSQRLVLPVIILAMPLLVLAVEKPATLDTDPNLVGWWKFDETVGTTAADFSRHKRDGTLKGELSFDRHSAPGKMDRALQFGGQGALVEIKDYKGIGGTHPRTVAAWIKTDSTRGEIVSWGAEDFGQMFIVGHIRGRIGVTPQGGYLYMNDETNDNEWHHVAVVVEQAEAPNLHDNVTLYLDGEPAVIHDIGLLDLWPIQTGQDLDVRIGRGFKGLLDDLRIYDRPLSDEQVKALFQRKTDQPLSESK